MAVVEGKDGNKYVRVRARASPESQFKHGSGQNILATSRQPTCLYIRARGFNEACHFRLFTSSFSPQPGSGYLA